MTEQSKILYEQKRMCRGVKDCAACPLDCHPYCLRAYRDVTPEKANEAVESILRWASEHPEAHQKTYAEDFFEKFPNAPKYEDGTPKAFACHIYTKLNYEECEIGECTKCWNQSAPID